MEQTIYSVSDINKYIKNVLTSDESLKFIYVKGEISNFKASASGHIYFSLKDKDSLINAVMFSNYASKIDFEVKNGDEVTVLASIDAYVPRGSYQLFVYELKIKGKGDYLEKLNELKKKLAAEGLFDEVRKRIINKYPSKIGVISAKNSAAIKDISYNVFKRYPLADILFFPSQVQGENAPKELLEAFKKSQQYDIDTLIIARGGGANEDLDAFNDETLVRAIATSKVPVIAAIGHEIDSTLVDFVSDKRVSTPTASALEATTDINEIEQRIDLYKEDLAKSLYDKVERYIDDLSFYKDKINSSLKNKIENYELRIELNKKRLSSISPYNILSRGYSIAKNKEGKVITSKAEVKPHDIIITSFSDGNIISEVKEGTN